MRLMRMIKRATFGRAANMLMVSLALLALVCYAYAVAAPDGGGSDAAAATSSAFEITWVGDMLLLEPRLRKKKKNSNKKKDIKRNTIESHGHGHPLAKVKHLLKGDYVIGVQEGPVTAINMTGEELLAIGKGDPCCYREGMSYGATPPAARAEQEAGIRAVSLANNHMFDKGEDGFYDTMKELDTVGIRYFGGGRNSTEASKPHAIEIPGGSGAKLCVVGLYDPETGNAMERRETWSANARSPGMWFANEETIADGYAQAKKMKCTTVVASIHWGQNYKGISDVQQDLARVFVDEGYDLVVGHHPHVIQPLKMIENVPVIFSLGNFVFGTGGRFSEDFPGYGLVAKTAFDAKGLLKKIVFHCVYLDAKKLEIFQPQPCDDKEAREAFAKLLQIETAGNSFQRSEHGDLTATLVLSKDPADHVESEGQIVASSIELEANDDMDYYHYLSTGHSNSKLRTAEGERMMDTLMGRRPWWRKARGKGSRFDFWEKLDFCFERYDLENKCDERTNSLRVFNWLQKSIQIHEKHTLAKNLNRFKADNGIDLQWYPETHIVDGAKSLESVLPEIKKSFLKYSTDSKIKWGANRKDANVNMNGNLWIVKPAWTHQGKGIEVFDSYKDIETFLTDKRDEEGNELLYLVQKYIEKPLLYKGRKFDFRTHVLVTSDPKFYVYPYGYVRVSSTDYNVSNTDRNTHLTNVHIQMESGASEVKSMMTFEELEDYFEGRLVFSRDVIPQMKSCLEELFSATLDTLKPQSIKGRFFLYIADFMMDEDLNLHFIEMNAGAGTNNGIVKAFDNGFGVPYIQWYTRNMVEELFQKVLDPFFPIPARFIHSDAKQPPKLEIFEQVHLLEKGVNRSSTVQIPDSPIHTEL
jgi:hypothetical protein